MLLKPQRRSRTEVNAQITEFCYGMCSRRPEGCLSAANGWKIKVRKGKIKQTGLFLS